MTILLPRSVEDAVAALADDPSLLVLAGGTDLMVEANYGRRGIGDVLSLRRLDELRGWRREGDEIVIGAGTTYTDLLAPDLAALAPALAQAARTVGSPQIRNAGTLGGNLATASPAGDTLPVLVATDATVELVSRTGRRSIRVASFLTGPKQTTRRVDELVASVRLPVADGPQEFLKIGTRNAMVIAVASCAVVVRTGERTIGCALGSVGPVPVRDRGAEAWLGDRIDWSAPIHVPPTVGESFGGRLAEAARPIDDHRATAAYRRHAVAVLVARALERLG